MCVCWWTPEGIYCRLLICTWAGNRFILWFPRVNTECLDRNVNQSPVCWLHLSYTVYSLFDNSIKCLRQQLLREELQGERVSFNVFLSAGRRDRGMEEKDGWMEVRGEWSRHCFLHNSFSFFLFVCCLFCPFFSLILFPFTQQFLTPTEDICLFYFLCIWTHPTATLIWLQLRP